jgi:hypothetical protein
MELAEFTPELIKNELDHFLTNTNIENDKDLYAELDEILKESSSLSNVGNFYDLKLIRNKDTNSILKLENIDLTDQYLITRILVSILAVNGAILPSKVFVQSVKIEGIIDDCRQYRGDVYISIDKTHVDKFIRCIEDNKTIIKYTDCSNTYTSETEKSIMENNKLYINYD